MLWSRTGLNRKRFSVLAEAYRIDKDRTKLTVKIIRMP